MSPRKLGSQPDELQDLSRELLQEENANERPAPEQDSAPAGDGLQLFPQTPQSDAPPEKPAVGTRVISEESAADHRPETASGSEADHRPQLLSEELVPEDDAEREQPRAFSSGFTEEETPEPEEVPLGRGLQLFARSQEPPLPEDSPGYEEFAEVPTGSYTAQEGPYGGGDAAYSEDELTGGGRRSGRGRPESGRTGSVPKIPLKELNGEDIKELSADAEKQRLRSARRKNRILAWVFCGFTFGILILFWAMPKSYFSDEERSVLAAEPTFTPRTVFDGEFEEDAETYVSDHFPFRSFWIGLNSYYNLASGRPLINGVYVGKDGYFIEEPVANDEARLTANLEAVKAFLTERRLPASFLAVPSTGYIMKEMLPDVHLPYHDADILASARLHLDGYADWIDIAADLKAESAVEQVFYRTDHHWTTLGAYIGYIRWAQQKGIAPTPVDRFRISYYDGFRGTTYAKVLLWGVRPDMIQLWELNGRYTVEMSDGNETPEVTDTFYDIPALTSYDPYMVFFGGNHGLMHIHNNDPEASGSLLLIKDSFANCFIPFIAPHYADMYVMDPRYYKNLRGLCDQTQLDEVLFVYSASNLIVDQDLGLIDM